MKPASKSQIKRLSSQKNKPIKKYTGLLFFKVGHSALIGVKKIRRTTVVIKYLGNGSFETLNTIYVPQNPQKYDYKGYDI